MTAEGQRCRGGSAGAPASEGRGVDPFDLCGQLERDSPRVRRTRARPRSARPPRGPHRARRQPRRIAPTAPRGRVGTARRVATRGRAACCERRGAGVGRDQRDRRSGRPLPPARRPWQRRAPAARSRGRAALRRWPRAPRPSARRRVGPVRARRGGLRSRGSVRRRDDREDVVGDLPWRRCRSQQRSGRIRGRRGGLGDESR